MNCQDNSISFWNGILKNEEFDMNPDLQCKIKRQYRIYTVPEKINKLDNFIIQSFLFFEIKNIEK